MNHENVINELNSIMMSVPVNATPIEKIRYIYIKVGEVFSYDYYYLENQDTYKIRFENDYIDRYITCKELSQILALMINNLDRENIKCEVIDRSKSMIRGYEENNHVANLVTLSNGEKYILDLTLDLHLIQSGCQTKEFGYTMMNDEDIIPLRECEDMDRKLGLMKGEEYTDKRINELSNRVNQSDFDGMSFDEKIFTKIHYLNSVMFKFRGLQEGKNYIKMLLSRIVRCNFKEFNLRGTNGEMITCYLLSGGYDEQVWYLYDVNKGLVKTTPENIFGMLQNGWDTKSISLDEILENSMTR